MHPAEGVRLSAVHHRHKTSWPNSGHNTIACLDRFSSLQIYSLPAMERAAVIPTDTPINYTALSPDAKQLAAVGDHPQL